MEAGVIGHRDRLFREDARLRWHTHHFVHRPIATLARPGTIIRRQAPTTFPEMDRTQAAYTTRITAPRAPLHVEHVPLNTEPVLRILGLLPSFDEQRQLCRLVILEILLPHPPCQKSGHTVGEEFMWHTVPQGRCAGPSELRTALIDTDTQTIQAKTAGGAQAAQMDTRDAP